MNSLILTIQNPFSPMVPILLGVALLVVLIVVVGEIIVHARTTSYSDVRGSFATVGAISLLFYGFVSFGVVMGVNAQSREDRAVAQLEDKGYSDVQVLDERFTANHDGDYVSGDFIERDYEHFIVVFEG